MCCMVYVYNGQFHSGWVSANGIWVIARRNRDRRSRRQIDILTDAWEGLYAQVLPDDLILEYCRIHLWLLCSKQFKCMRNLHSARNGRKEKSQFKEACNLIWPPWTRLHKKPLVMEQGRTKVQSRLQLIYSYSPIFAARTYVILMQ